MLGVESQNALSSSLQQRMVASFTSAQGPFRRDTLDNVLDGAEHTDRLPGNVEAHLGPLEDRALAAVRTDDTVFDTPEA